MYRYIVRRTTKSFGVQIVSHLFSCVKDFFFCPCLCFKNMNFSLFQSMAETALMKETAALLSLKKKIDKSSVPQLQEFGLTWAFQLLDTLKKTQSPVSARMASISIANILERASRHSTSFRSMSHAFVPTLFAFFKSQEHPSSHLPSLLQLLGKTMCIYPKAMTKYEVEAFIAKILKKPLENSDAVLPHLSAVLGAVPRVLFFDQNIYQNSLRRNFDNVLKPMFRYLDLPLPSEVNEEGNDSILTSCDREINNEESFSERVRLFEIFANAVINWKYLPFEIYLDLTWCSYFTSVLEIFNDESMCKKVGGRKECALFEIVLCLCLEVLISLISLIRLSPSVPFRFGERMWHMAVTLLPLNYGGLHLKSTQMRLCLYKFLITFIQSKWHIHLTETAPIQQLLNIIEDDLSVSKTSGRKSGYPSEQHSKDCKEKVDTHNQDDDEIVICALSVIRELMDNNIRFLYTMEVVQLKTGEGSIAVRCLKIIIDSVMLCLSQSLPVFDKPDVLSELCATICSTCCGAVTLGRGIVVPSFLFTFLKSCRSRVDSQHRVALETYIRRMAMYTYTGQMESSLAVTPETLPSRSQDSDVDSSCDASSGSETDEKEAEAVASVESDHVSEEEEEVSSAPEPEEFPSTSRKRQSASPEICERPPKMRPTVASPVVTPEVEHAPISEPEAPTPIVEDDPEPDDDGNGPSLSEMLSAFDPGSESD